jgi:hypothetical protein
MGGVDRMTERSKKPQFPLDVSFEEALTRLVKGKPGELADAIAKELSERMKEATNRISGVREDISRGARTSKEKFRL